MNTVDLSFLLALVVACCCRICNDYHSSTKSFKILSSCAQTAKSFADMCTCLHCRNGQLQIPIVTWPTHNNGQCTHINGIESIAHGRSDVCVPFVCTFHFSLVSGFVRLVRSGPLGLGGYLREQHSKTGQHTIRINFADVYVRARIHHTNGRMVHMIGAISIIQPDMNTCTLHGVSCTPAKYYLGLSKLCLGHRSKRLAVVDCVLKCCETLSSAPRIYLPMQATFTFNLTKNTV